MSYDEHLISMAGGDGDVLDQIREARAQALEEAANAMAFESPFHDYADTEAHWRIGNKWARILRARAAAVRGAS